MEIKKQKKTFWKLSSEELKDQVDNYNTLKITKSYRGISVLLISGLIMLGFLLSFFEVLPFSTFEDMLWSLIIYVPVLFFVYRGHRWAIVSLFVLWTLEKIYTLILTAESGGFVLGSVIWWFIVAPYIYRALLVENARKKATQTSVSAVSPEIVIASHNFCSNCGAKLETGINYCSSCGAKLT